jgi:hypothetical protein
MRGAKGETWNLYYKASALRSLAFTASRVPRSWVYLSVFLESADFGSRPLPQPRFKVQSPSQQGLARTRSATAASW